MSKEQFKRNKPEMSQKPTPPPPPPPNGLVITGTGSDIVSFTVDLPGNTDTDAYYIIEATNPMSPGVMSPPNSAFKLIASVLSSDIIGVTDETIGYKARVKSTSVGAKVFARISSIDSVSGQRNLLATINTIVTAA